MYNYIKGKIAEVGESTVVIDVGGVGYELNVSAATAAELSMMEGEVKLPCLLSVREDEMSLFGFLTKREKSVFQKLISVSGVGPRLALTILGGLSATDLAAAIVRSDVAALLRVKGVGKKTAERIVLELRDKIEIDGDMPTQIPTAAPSSINEEAVLALMTLGYSRQEAATAVEKVQADGMTLEQIVYSALKAS